MRAYRCNETSWRGRVGSLVALAVVPETREEPGAVTMRRQGRGSIPRSLSKKPRKLLEEIHSKGLTTYLAPSIILLVVRTRNRYHPQDLT